MKNKLLNTRNWVLLRGLSRSKFHWLDFPKKIETAFNTPDVFCPELAGNGERHQESSPNTIDAAVEDLRKQLPVNYYNTGYILCAVSLGAMIANRWIELHPTEVKGVVLINTSFKNISPFYHRMQFCSFLELFRGLWIKDVKVKEQIILDRTSNDTVIQKSVLDLFTDFHKKHPLKLQNIANQIHISQQAYFAKKPDCPTLIINSKLDRLVSKKCSMGLAKKFDLPIQIHPKAGHDITLDDPAWVIDRLKEFFKN